MTDEEDVTAQLLRLAGAPPKPTAERTARVREVVHREWRVSRRRRLVRRAAAIAMLGVAASLMIAVWMNRPRPVVAPGDRVVAIGQRIQGRPLIVRQSQRDGAPQLLSVSTSIHADDVIETDEASRAALQAGDGSSVRIDRSSRVRFLAPAVIEVAAGAVYVATSDGSHGFEVRTAMGGLRDVGTQFEVRLTPSSLRLRVRAGTVEIQRGSSVTTARPGTEAIVTTGGVAVRQVPPYGSEWAWTADVAPSFAIDGRTLGDFLEHTAAEEGWKLHFADPDVGDAAKRIILHGSVEGLRAEDALRGVLATSGLQYRLRAGELLVSRAADAR
jgi:ferric-dicitrate binding protein FerR (iron transport regulator)